MLNFRASYHLNENTWICFVKLNARGNNASLSSLSLQILLTVWSWFSSDYVVLSGLYHSLSYTSLFSLPWVLVHAILRLFLPFCPCALFVCLVCFCLFSFCLLKVIYWGNGQNWRQISVTLQNQYFLFIEEFPLSLPIILGVIRWDSYSLILTAQPSCKRRLVTGWSCHLPYQLVLDTEEMKPLRSLTVASCPSKLEQSICNQCSK